MLPAGAIAPLSHDWKSTRGRADARNPERGSDQKSMVKRPRMLAPLWCEALQKSSYASQRSRNDASRDESRIPMKVESWLRHGSAAKDSNKTACGARAMGAARRCLTDELLDEGPRQLVDEGNVGGVGERDEPGFSRWKEDEDLHESLVLASMRKVEIRGAIRDFDAEAPPPAGRTRSGTCLRKRHLRA